MSLTLTFGLVIFYGSAYIISTPFSGGNVGRQSETNSLRDNEIDTSEGFLDSNEHLSNIRKNNDNTTHQKPCQGYVYDVTKCKYINNRLLCGYDKNKGNKVKDTRIVDIGNGCRIRNNRIECGYVEKPFNIDSRRPPAYDIYLETTKNQPKLSHLLAYTRVSTDQVTKIPNADKDNKNRIILTTKHINDNDILNKHPTEINFLSKLFTTNNTSVKVISDTKQKPESIQVTNETIKNATTNTIKNFKVSDSILITKTLKASQTPRTKQNTLEPRVDSTTISQNCSDLPMSMTSFLPSTITILIKRTRRNALTKNKKKHKTYCVDKQESIVCYDF